MVAIRRWNVTWIQSLMSRSIATVVRGEERIGVRDLVREARARVRRLTPTRASEQLAQGAILIDIRSDSQRERDGVIPGAVFVPRNVLEWRLDPSSPHRAKHLARRDRRMIVICEGFQSSLAAATLNRMGLDAGDVIGGFQAWLSAGFPVSRQGAG
jgi:rhodanese-related sulfurtransferase